MQKQQESVWGALDLHHSMLREMDHALQEERLEEMQFQSTTVNTSCDRAVGAARCVSVQLVGMRCVYVENPMNDVAMMRVNMNVVHEVGEASDGKKKRWRVLVALVVATVVVVVLVAVLVPLSATGKLKR